MGLEMVWAPGYINAVFTALKDALRILHWQEASLEGWCPLHPQTLAV